MLACGGFVFYVSNIYKTAVVNRFYCVGSDGR